MGFKLALATLLWMWKGELILCLNYILHFTSFITWRKFFVTNWEPPKLFANAFKPVCRCTFQHLQANFKNLLEIKLTTDLTLPFFQIIKLSVNNDWCFFALQVWAVRSTVYRLCMTTKSTKIFYISVRITWTIKLSIKKNSKIKMISFLVRSKYLT